LAHDLAQPFDLAAGPPLRMRLVRRTSDGRCLVLMVLHRIAADDRSRELIASEVLSAYRGRTVPAPTLDYGDFAEWQRELSASAAARHYLDFWRTALAGVAPAELPADRPRAPTRDWRSGTVRFEVTPQVARALSHAAAENEATLFMGLLAGVFAVLAQSTGGTDLTVGVPASGRDRPELEHVVGMVEETAVIRVDAGGQP